MKENLTFRLYTLDSQTPETECDYVKLCIADDIRGGFSGSYGIRKGHARTVFSLKEGRTEVYKDGKVVYSALTSEGFAMVEDNEVSVTVDSVKE